MSQLICGRGGCHTHSQCATTNGNSRKLESVQTHRSLIHSTVGSGELTSFTSTHMQTFEKQLVWKEQDTADHFLHVAVPPRFTVLTEQKFLHIQPRLTRSF